MLSILIPTKDYNCSQLVEELHKQGTSLGVPFEINTGAISRGYQDNPYPSETVIKMIKERGGKFILNSDSHSVDTIAFEFDKWKYLI